jgi:soluble lytic murein transglycosylase
MSAPLSTYKVTDLEVDEIANTPAFQRAEALQRLDLKWEAKSEWALATKDFDDKQLLAAAEFAARKKWYDLAIFTADKTTETHDFALRYPTPYRDLMKPAAGEQGVDEAWVYGITRQESRFMHYAKSGVGASGLMQLMPATAKWAAPRAGISNYNNSMIHELDTNITLGTYYMSHTLEIFNGQEVMATAAYNAGPSRAKKWVAAIPLEGAIYAETIPFSETRSYVQKVMANAHLYAMRLGLKPIPLKKRLGVIPSSGGLVAGGDDNAEPEVIELAPIVETK